MNSHSNSRLILKLMHVLHYMYLNLSQLHVHHTENPQNGHFPATNFKPPNVRQ